MKKVIKFFMKVIWAHARREYNKGRLLAIEAMSVNNAIKNILRKLKIK